MPPRTSDEVGLATVQVRQFQRTERGRRENVRQHTETRAVRQIQQIQARRTPANDILGHLSTDHDIPEAAWMAGQKEWQAKGEAAWKAAGNRYAAMHDRDHTLGVTDHEHAEPVTSDAVADALARKAGRSPSQRPSMAGKLAQAQSEAKGGMEGSPLIGSGNSPKSAGTPKASSLGDKASGAKPLGANALAAAAKPNSAETVKQTAIRAMAAAAVASRNYTEAEAQQALNDVKQLAAEADKELEEQGKARVVTHIAWVLAGVVLAAVTGGMGLPLLVSIVLGLLPTAAGEIFDVALVERGHGRQAVVKAAQKTSSAAKKAATRKKTALTAQQELAISFWALAAAAGGISNSPVAMTREVLVRALTAKGAPEDVADAIADGAIEEAQRTLMIKKAGARMADQQVNERATASRIPVDELVRRGNGRIHEEPDTAPAPARKQGTS
jgi:hypothetical protein